MLDIAHRFTCQSKNDVSNSIIGNNLAGIVHEHRCHWPLPLQWLTLRVKLQAPITLWIGVRVYCIHDGLNVRWNRITISVPTLPSARLTNPTLIRIAIVGDLKLGKY
jgi:hypothetical protein